MFLKTGIRTNFFIFISGFIICAFLMNADSQKYPVDISFYAVDLKYSSLTGVKICEIQHGIYSYFRGERFSYGGKGHVPANFLKIISQIPGPHWMNHNAFADEGIREAILGSTFCKVANLSQVLSDPVFRLNASLPVEDPNDISYYHGMVCLRLYDYEDIDTFRSNFPGIIAMDASGHEYWQDKYNMTALFANDPELAKFKPRWNIYPKKYTNDLADNIKDDLKCDRFVIKPRYAYKGNGVIIVDKENLDAVLYYIFHKTLPLMRDKDLGKRYWYSDKSESFLVEEFAPSDPVAVAHLDGRLFEPTVRVGVFVIYNKGSISVEHCGAYLRLPSKSLDELGTLNEKYKDITAQPYFDKVDPETYEKIKDDLNIALPLLYKQMLHP